MVRIVSDTSTMYSTTQAKEAGFTVSPLTVTIAGKTYREYDEIDSQTLERNEEIDRAILAATYGDYSFLNDLGINTDDVSGITDWEKEFALAEAIANLTGDSSYLYQLASQMR